MDKHIIQMEIVCILQDNQIVNTDMSNPNCMIPQCSFNCCNAAGQCPASKDQCFDSSDDSSEMDVVIYILLIFILGVGINAFMNYRKREQSLEQRKRQYEEEQVRSIDDKLIQIQLGEGVPKIVVNKVPRASHKSVCIDEEENKEDNLIQKRRSGSSNSSKKSLSVDNNKFLLNPFDKKSMNHNRLL